VQSQRAKEGRVWRWCARLFWKALWPGRTHHYLTRRREHWTLASLSRLRC